MKIARDFGELEAVHRREGKDDGVFGRCRLQLEVEGAAEALAQGQAPGAVDPTAERGVDDELHAAGFVEEALEDDRVTGWQRAECRAAGGEIADELHGRWRLDADLVDEPAEGGLECGGEGGCEEL